MSDKQGARPALDRARVARLCEWLAREESAYLARIARRNGVPRGEVEDVVQDALADVLRSFPGPDEPGKARSYAGKCVQSRAYKRHRRFVRKERALHPLTDFQR